MAGRFEHMSREQFVNRFGGVYEHSPWIADALYGQGLSEELASAASLASGLAKIVDGAAREARLALLRAHPDLAGKLAIGDAMTEASTSEQAGAGLDQCSPEEFETFHALNASYKAKFGFPFIVAVKGWQRQDILKAFEARVTQDLETEFAEAIAQVHRIARLRLDDIFEELG